MIRRAALAAATTAALALSAAPVLAQEFYQRQAPQYSQPGQGQAPGGGPGQGQAPGGGPGPSGPGGPAHHEPETLVAATASGVIGYVEYGRHGEMKHAWLEDGTKLELPKHDTRFAPHITQGATVTVEGFEEFGRQGEYEIEVHTLTAPDGTVVSVIDTRTVTVGYVEYGRYGELKGFFGTDGLEVDFPRARAEEVADLIVEGTVLEVTGIGEYKPHGEYEVNAYLISGDARSHDFRG